MAKNSLTRDFCICCFWEPEASSKNALWSSLCPLYWKALKALNAVVYPLGDSGCCSSVSWRETLSVLAKISSVSEEWSEASELRNSALEHSLFWLWGQFMTFLEQDSEFRSLDAELSAWTREPESSPVARDHGLTVFLAGVVASVAPPFLAALNALENVSACNAIQRIRTRCFDSNNRVWLRPISIKLKFSFDQKICRWQDYLHRKQKESERQV